jgi:hypothetical protein
MAYILWGLPEAVTIVKKGPINGSCAAGEVYGAHATTASCSLGPTGGDTHGTVIVELYDKNNALVKKISKQNQPNTAWNQVVDLQLGVAANNSSTDDMIKWLVDVASFSSGKVVFTAAGTRNYETFFFNAHANNAASYELEYGTLHTDISGNGKITVTYPFTVNA